MISMKDGSTETIWKRITSEGNEIRLMKGIRIAFIKRSRREIEAFISGRKDR